jgi:hypothetical protein
VRTVPIAKLWLITFISILATLSLASSQTPPVTAHFGRDGRVLLPDASVTPGAVLTTDAAKVCQAGYSSTMRDVPLSVKKQAYTVYGIRPSTRTVNGQTVRICCEVDHLVSLELGGSNDIKNLWPQPYYPRPGAHEKDVLENWLHKQVCAGTISIERAQQAIAQDWYTAYQHMH